eukprot:scaffold254008_cov14-Tisochrysis_lutea.AAC.1
MVGKLMLMSKSTNASLQMLSHHGMMPAKQGLRAFSKCKLRLLLKNTSRYLKMLEYGRILLSYTTDGELSAIELKQTTPDFWVFIIEIQSEIPADVSSQPMEHGLEIIWKISSEAQ